MYRPNGFKKILRDKMNEAVVSRGGLPLFDEDYADIGADAMLEGLKAKDDTQYGILDSNIHANDYYFEIYEIGGKKFGQRIFDKDGNEKGWLVFISDD